MLLALGVLPLAAEEGLHGPGAELRPDPGLEWLAVEREPVLKVEPEVLGPILRGKASYYGKTPRFQGRRTASGERFDRRAFTAASNRFPLGSWIAVRRPGTDHCVVAWVNDRMHDRQQLRIVDLSLAAAESIQLASAGVVQVEARALRGAPGVEPAICLQAFEAEASL
ncbi:MAG: septal ring lytic transglycosylase RlpA family protein [Azovibrio sp.]